VDERERPNKKAEHGRGNSYDKKIAVGTLSLAGEGGGQAAARGEEGTYFSGVPQKGNISLRRGIKPEKIEVLRALSERTT